MWMEEEMGVRINMVWIEQVFLVSLMVISFGCFYCLIMFGDGMKVKEVEDEIGIYDVSELFVMFVFGVEK